MLTTQQIYVYPVKSLRGISLRSASLTPQGLRHDRRFMLLHVLPDGTLKNMHVAHYPACTLFHTSYTAATLSPDSNLPSLVPSEDASSVTVTYKAPGSVAAEWPEISIPLALDVTKLKTVDVTMHASSTAAYNAGDPYNAFFSTHFGHPVMLAYIGPHLRPVLGSLSPSISSTSAAQAQTSGWLSSLSSYVLSLGAGAPKDERARIAFSDCAPFLVVSEASLRDVHPRLPDAENMDITKFRPNIIVDALPPSASSPSLPDESLPAWDEDFWGELTIRGSEERSTETKILLTANCARCVSVNIDYATGKAGEGPQGKVLKSLMKDRRVDKGVKYSPVFGRYGFLNGNGDEKGKEIVVGDEVVVSGRNTERTTFGECVFFIKFEGHRCGTLERMAWHIGGFGRGACKQMLT